MSIHTDTVVTVCRCLSALLLVFVAYPYVIYPAILWLLSRWSRVRWLVEDYHPTISVVMAAYNEAAILRQKLQNTLALDYPRDRMEILVVSDCSSDATDEIARSFAPEVKLVRLEDRSGKQIALNRAAEQATGSILLFTDASVNLAPQVAKCLARNFADPRVGAVSTVIKITHEGPDRFPVAEDRGSDDAEDAYLGFDTTVRYLESQVFSAVGCCGSCYAVRKACFSPFLPADCNDFASALDAVRGGYRVVMDRQAVGYMLPAKTIEGEFRRKARTIAGGLGTLAARQHWPSFSYLVFWWCLLSHKVARWLGPAALLMVLPIALVGAAAFDPLLVMLFLAIATPLTVGYVGLTWPSLRRNKFIRMASFTLTAVVASLEGWRLFLTGRLPVVWNPTQRVDHAPQVQPTSS